MLTEMPPSSKFSPIDLGLTDHVALITAGANGIGEGSAIALARFGAHIVIADIDVENGERVAAAIRGCGRESLFVATDAMDVGQVQATVAATAQRFGRLDVLVNNAGGVRPRPFLEQNERNWRRIIDLNFVSMLAATQAAARQMIAGGHGGAIVNVASSESFRAAPLYSVYAACKAAMLEFTKTMALELAEHGIRVNAIAPDAIDTPGIRPPADTPAEVLALRTRHVPMQRLASIHEAGATVAFLASALSSFVTGATLPVDGGIVAAGGWIRTKDGDWGFGA
jgi:NAD(P)-dependent dehydrogenase (short-subunit alcohol dehydrogenase family)